MKHARPPRLISAGIALAIMGAAMAGALPASASTQSTLTVAYPSVCAFDSGPLATKWWDQVKVDFSEAYPNVTVKYIAIPGSYQDYVNSLSALYRSASTAPDVAELPSAQLDQWSSSDYLLPLNSYLKTSSWFRKYPKVIKEEGEFNGKIYAVNAGENDNALMYNEAIFKKVGIAVPWTPTSWQDIITTAKRIKSRMANVTPLWLDGGTDSGEVGLLEGINNFIAGSSTPTIQTLAGKMVIDSPGIRAALGFYRQVYADGLGPSERALLNPNAAADLPSLLKAGKIGIAIGSNADGGDWTKLVGTPYWPRAASTIGVASLPNEAGTGIASALSGWDLAISSRAPDPKTAYDFISVAQEPSNVVDSADWAGWVPPVKSDWALRGYTKFAPPFSADFAKIVRHGIETPTSPKYPIWAQGMNEATGEFVDNPNTSVGQALRTLEKFVTEQLGSASVTTLR
ncbi:MAG: ABC transporter substrate-binding protein [Acidimicrobiales bacterium]